MLASSWMDLVLGLDIHLHVVPMVGPTPIPQIFLGMVGDPVGAIVAEIQSAVISLVRKGKVDLPRGIVLINGLPATTTDSIAKNRLLVIHVAMPPGVAHVKTPSGDATFLFGSLTVTFGGANAVRLGEKAFSCSDPVRLPTATVIVIPKGPPVLVGGPPGINPQQALAKWAMGRIFRTAFGGASKLAKLAARLSPARRRGLLSAKKCTTAGDPVDVATGRVLTDAIDFALPGPLPLTLERNYSSAWSARDGVLGPGWSHSLDQAVWFEEGLAVYRNQEGQEIVFDTRALQAKGGVVGKELFEPVSRNTLVRARDGWRVITAEGLVHRLARIPGETDPRDGFARLVRTTTRNKGIAITYTYDDRARLLAVQDSVGRTVKLEHDDRGRLTRVLLPSPDQPQEWVPHVEYRYSKEGLLAEVCDAEGKPTKYDYDGGLLVQRTDRNGLSFYWMYDGRGASARCVRTWGDGGIYNQKIDYVLPDRTTIVTDSYKNRTMYRMNELGAIVEVTDAKGNKTLREYDDDLRLVRETDGEENETARHEYGPRGQMLMTTLADKSQVVYKYDPRFPELVKLFRDEVGAVWRHSYDDNGQVVQTHGPAPDAWRLYEWENGAIKAVVEPGDCRTEVVERDGRGNPTAVKLPNGTIIRREFDRRGRLVTLMNPYQAPQRRRYDLRDRLVEVQEPDGNVRHVVYDAEDNVLEAVDRLLRVRFTYIGFNRLASREEGAPDGRPGDKVTFGWGLEGELREIRNERNHDYKFQYDACLRLEREIGFDLQETRYRRDKAGRVVKVEKPRAHVHTDVVLDPVGRVVELKHSDGTFAKFKYRRDGSMMEATNQTTTVTFERDALGRVVKEIQGGVEVISRYAGGFRTTLESTLGAALTIARDAYGNPTAVSLGLQELGWVRTVGIEYDGAGLETRRTLPGGVVAEWHRDGTGRPARRIVHGGPATGWFQDLAWSFDDRLTAIADSRFGTATYVHDHRGRLVAEKHGETTTYRTLDELGNVYRTPDRSDRRYVRGGILRHDGETSFVFDGLGNMTAKIEPGEREWRYKWDGAGMLTEVTKPGGTKIAFAYDALGRRVSKKVGETETRWIWDGDVILHELQGQSTITWYHEPETFTPMARVENGRVVHHVVADQLGTPTAMYDFAGKVAWEMQLDVFGVPRSHEGVVAGGLCPFRWPGQYEDAETGLSYNRFRYFDAHLGEFISQDPVTLLGGISLYSYVADPTTWLDPLGLAACNARVQPIGGEDQFGVHRYTWPGDAGAYVSFKINGSLVIVDRVARGGQPKGTAGLMLADAMRVAGVRRPTELIAPNVLAKRPNSVDVIERMMRNAAEELGGKVRSANRGIDVGKLWVKIHVGYP